MNLGGCKRPGTIVALEKGKVVYFLIVKRFREILPLGVVVFFCWSGPLFADYTLVLKNGRRITVQSYREEAGMIKFYGLGGEIGIAKDQIQSILKAGEMEGRGMVLPGSEGSAVGFRETRQEEKKVASPPREGGDKIEGKKQVSTEPKESVLTPEERLAAERAKEEKEYQRRVKELTEQMKATMDRYSLATRGSSGPEPTTPVTPEEMRTRADDLISRLRDSQHNPVGPSETGGVKLTDVPSPFTGAPPTTMELRPPQVAPRVDAPLPDYSAKQKELSNLRNQINQLQRERERLIQEMRQKNFDTGSLFLE